MFWHWIQLSLVRFFTFEMFAESWQTDVFQYQVLSTSVVLINSMKTNYWSQRYFYSMSFHSMMVQFIYVESEYTNLLRSRIWILVLGWGNLKHFSWINFRSKKQLSDVTVVFDLRIHYRQMVFFSFCLITERVSNECNIKGLKMSIISIRHHSRWIRYNTLRPYFWLW